jgi:hypothetical protein
MYLVIAEKTGVRLSIEQDPITHILAYLSSQPTATYHQVVPTAVARLTKWKEL